MPLSQPILDRPDSKLQAILLKPPSAWTEKERKRVAQRLSVEREHGLGPGNANSIFYDPAYAQAAQEGAAQEGAAKEGTAKEGAAKKGAEEVPGATGTPIRGGSKAFTDTMDNFAAYMQRIRDGAVDVNLRGPRRRLNIQTPGNAYRANNPAIALTPEERARGAAVFVPPAASPSPAPSTSAAQSNQDTAKKKPDTAPAPRADAPAQEQPRTVQSAVTSGGQGSPKNDVAPIYSIKGLGQQLPGMVAEGARENLRAGINLLDTLGRYGGSVVRGLWNGNYAPIPAGQGIVEQTARRIGLLPAEPTPVADSAGGSGTPPPVLRPPARSAARRKERQAKAFAAPFNPFANTLLY